MKMIVMNNTKGKIIFNSYMSRKVIICDFSAHNKIISKISISVIRRTIKELSSQCTYTSTSKKPKYPNINGF